MGDHLGFTRAIVLLALRRAEREGQSEQCESKDADGEANEDHDTYRIQRITMASVKLAVRARTMTYVNIVLTQPPVF
jgi:hypothetical protein